MSIRPDDSRPPTPIDLPPGYGGLDLTEARWHALCSHAGRRETIGRSREGRPIDAFFWGGTTGDGATERERVVLVLSLLHPMEWIGLEAHLALIEACVADARSGGSSAPPRIVSVPIANPDGFARVEESLREDRPRWVRGNTARIDLNRNFPVGHTPRRPPFDRWPLYRPGPFALSEPESAAIADLARAIRPSVALSLHAFGRWVFYPPARRRKLSGTTLERARSAAADHARRARRAVRGTGYRAGPLDRWSPFFRAGGTELDFLQEELGALSFLIEISQGGIARWGAPWRRHPFALFNPPDPRREIDRVLPVLRSLLEPGGPDGAARVKG